MVTVRRGFSQTGANHWGMLWLPETQGEKGTGAKVDSWNTAGGVGKEGRKETQGKQTTAKGGN